MACSSNNHDKHCLCEVNYPYRRIASSHIVDATRMSDCTIIYQDERSKAKEINQKLGFEANMDLVDLDEFINFVPHNARFGSYINFGKGGHFCVDHGRRTVDGRRLNWLWIFKDGKTGKSNKMMDGPPPAIWTKDNIIAAYTKANNPSLPMFTRHVEIYPELAITFCLPRPSP